jgi:hypothetical protein
MSTYAVCDGNGNILADGVEEHEAYEIAQRIADRLGETVRLSLAGSDDVGEEVAPGAIAVAVKKIKEAANLLGLLDALQKYGALIGLAGDRADYRIDLAKDLPTFGGERPVKHLEAYSWDAGHVLVGSGDGPFPTKWRIVPREDWEKVA